MVHKSFTICDVDYCWGVRPKDGKHLNHRDVRDPPMAPPAIPAATPAAARRHPTSMQPAFSAYLSNTAAPAPAPSKPPVTPSPRSLGRFDSKPPKQSNKGKAAEICQPLFPEQDHNIHTADLSVSTVLYVLAVVVLFLVFFLVCLRY